MEPFDLIGPGEKGFLPNTADFTIPEDYNPQVIKINVKATPPPYGITVTTFTADELAIIEACDAIKEFLLAKNKNYGNSALEPQRIFSKAHSNEQILIRMDDKLSRIKNSSEPKMNDIVDLTGYLILYIVKKEWTSEIKEMID